MRPTERTLQYLKKHGHLAGVVERFNAHAGPFGQRFDLFGLFDVVAVIRDRNDRQGGHIAAIQCCAGTGRKEHERKMLDVVAADLAKDESNFFKLLRWLRAGGKAELWAWRKRVKLKKDLTPSKTPAWTASVTVFSLTNNRLSITTSLQELP